jgi:gliding motility-associated-like protein
MKAVRLLLYFFCIPIFAIAQKINCETTISVDCGVLTASGGLGTGSQTIFCEGQLVEFVNKTDPGQGVDSTFFCWGDGTITKVSGLQNATHVYNFPDDTCVAQPLIPINIRMIIIKRCSNGKFSLHSITTPIAIRLKPIPKFTVTSPICVGQEAAFNNLSCTNTASPLFSWDFGNGKISSSEAPPKLVYPSPGTYTIKLSIKNECATEVYTRDLRVLALPNAKAVLSLNRSTLCTNAADPLVATITDRSQNVTKYDWTITGGRFQYLNQTDNRSQNPVIQFNEAKTYKISLTGNGCGNAQWDTTIVIQALPNVKLNAVASDCKSISLVPANLVQYSGGDANQFLWTFKGISPGISNEKYPATPINYTQFGRYAIVVKASNICGSASDSIQFSIDSLQKAKIQPVTSFCTNNNPIQLQFSPIGGQWTGSGVDNRGLITPSKAGLGKNTYRYTIGSGSCASSASVDVEVGAPPKVSIQQVPSSCQSITVQNTNLATYQGGTGEQFQWWVIGADTTKFTSPQVPQALVFTQNRSYKIRINVQNFCGTSRDSTLFSIDVLAKITLDTVRPLCLSDAPIQLKSQPSGGKWSGSGVSTAGLFTPDSATPGLNALRYTIGSGSCVNTANLNITVNGSRVNAGSPIGLCSDAKPITLSGASPLGGIWKGKGVIDSLTGIFDSKIAGVGEQTLFYTFKQTGSGCVNQGNRKVTVFGLPKAGLDSISNACVGAPVQFKNRSAGIAQASWDFGDGGKSPSLSPTYTYQRKGDFTITLIARSTEGCTDTVQKKITVAQPVKAAFSVDPANGCAPLKVAIRNESIGDNPAFEWYLGAKLVSQLANPLALTLSPLTQDSTFVLRLKIGSSCNNQDLEKSIFVRALPFARFASQQPSYCSGQEVIFGHKSFADSLIWDFGNGKTYRGFDPPKQIYTTGTEIDTIRVRVTAINQCGRQTALQKIPIRPTDARAFFPLPDSVICLGSPLCLESFSRPKGSRLEWQFSDGNTDTGEKICHNFSKVGRYTIKLRVTSCGTDEANASIRVIDTLSIALAFAPEACVKTAVAFTINTSANEHRLFFTKNDSTAQKISTFRFDTAGVFRLRALARSPQGCISRVGGDIRIVAPPKTNFRLLDSVCAGVPIRAINQTIGSAACKWNIAGAVVDGCNPVFRFPSSGSFPIQLRTQDRLGCRDSISKTAFVRPSPKAGFVYTLSNKCTPVTLSLANRSNNAQAYRWTLSDSRTSILVNPDFRFQKGGDYKLTLVASLDSTCFDTLTQPVTINGTPQVKVSYEDPRCRPGDDALILVNGSLAVDYTYLFRRDTLLQQGVNRFQIKNSGTYRVDVKTIAGCDTSLQITVPEKQFILAKVMNDTTIKLGESIRIRTSINTKDATIRWVPDQYLDSGTVAEPTSMPQRSVRYILEVMQGACFLKDTIDIRVLSDKSIFFPNAFSPNGDNINDFYQFFPSYGVKEIHEFRIFERSGTLVFAGKDYISAPSPDKWWDGYFNGQPLNPDVYAFLAVVEFFDGKTEVLKGDLQLVR